MKSRLLTIFFALLLFSQTNHGMASGSPMHGSMPCGSAKTSNGTQEKCACCVLSQADRFSSKSFLRTSDKFTALPHPPLHHHMMHEEGHEHHSHVSSGFSAHPSWLQTVVQQK